MDTSFKVLHKILKATNMRQKVLASNIANADTPGYKAKDVKFGNLLNNEMKMMTTSSKHIKSTGSKGIGSSFTVETNPSWGDRNNVELNVETAKMTENALTHSAAIKILNTKIKMYKAAIRGR